MSIALDRRSMVFVDGENLTIRAQEFAVTEGLELVEGGNYRPDVFVWLPRKHPRLFYGDRPSLGLRLAAVRAYYYTSAVGAEETLQEVREQLWNLHFDARVFKKDKRQNKTKGVDVTLTKDMLSHAFMNNYDTAILVAGDGDYVPLVQELKRLGKFVIVSFLSDSRHGLSPQLRLESDYFWPLDTEFRESCPPRRS